MTGGLDPIALAHDAWLVALSIVVAMQGAYVGLSLAGRVGAAEGLRRRALVLGAAVSLAVGIWSMHFIGMLAARLPVAVDYLVVPTVFSFLVCVMVVGAAMLFAATDQPLLVRLGAGGAGMGAGIASMHYIGMGALAGSMTMHHAPSLVAVSVVLAMAASAAALWLCFEAHRPTLWASALAMGLAISGMHYTAMAGMTLHAAPEAASQFHSTLSPDGLALTVAIVAFAVSGAFLATLTPEGRAARALPEVPAAAPSAAEETAPQTLPIAAPPPAGAPEPPADAAPVRDAVVRPAPLGGAGARARKPLAALTVERAGAPLRLPVEAIRCVRANAHYTYVRDATQEYFCGLSIGEAEAALDPARFLRVHRSHIVNLDHVTAVRRAGDNGAVDLAGCGTVPVARGRLPALKRRFEAEQSLRVRPMDAAE